MTKKALDKAQTKIKKAVKNIQKHQTAENVWRFNLVILSIQNYYSAASRITIDLSKLNNRLNKALHNRLNEMRKEATFQDFSKSLQKRYKGYECKLYKIKEIVLAPIHAQRCKVNLSESVHPLINLKNREKIQDLLNPLNLNRKQLKKVNDLREQCLNEAI